MVLISDDFRACRVWRDTLLILLRGRSGDHNKTNKGLYIMTIVKTSELRKGDLILNNGCIMRIGDIAESKSHKPNGFGPVFYSKATVTNWESGSVPVTWFDVDSDGQFTWTVQGNDLAMWHRIEGGSV